MNYDLQELKAANNGREFFYTFLARCFKKEVDETLLKNLPIIVPKIEEMVEHSENDQLKQGLSCIKKFSKNISNEDLNYKELLLDLARDFAFLFLIGHNSIPTSESVFLSPEHLLKQEPREMVLKDYRAVGFNVSKDLKEPEDHIAVELEFMAKLSQLINESIQEKKHENVEMYMACQKDFLGEHLMKWVPQFCNLLTKAAKGRDFYQGLGFLTKEFISLDYEVR